MHWQERQSTNSASGKIEKWYAMKTPIGEFVVFDKKPGLWLIYKDNTLIKHIHADDKGEAMQYVEDTLQRVRDELIRFCEPQPLVQAKPFSIERIN